MTLNNLPPCCFLINGLHYWQRGGRGQCSGAEKTRSQKNAHKNAAHTYELSETGRRRALGKLTYWRKLRYHLYFIMIFIDH